MFSSSWMAPILERRTRALPTASSGTRRGWRTAPHSLTAVARDFYDNTATAADVGVTVSNVTVAMSAPSSGSVVSGGAVAVSATASDNVTGVQFQLDGANLGAEDTSAPYSIDWDTTAVPNGSYTLSAIAHDSVGNTGTATQTTVRVTNPSTSVFAPVLDTEVNADLPDTNFGKANALGVDGTPVRIGYLLFNVSIPPGEVVTKATLKLFTPSTSSADTFVHQVSNTEWSETATTYANAPPIGAQVAASGPYQGGSYVSWDVTQAVAGEGLVSFALRRSSPDGIPFNSREAASNQPQLIVESFPTDPSPPPPPPPDVPPTVSADGSSNLADQRRGVEPGGRQQHCLRHGQLHQSAAAGCGARWTWRSRCPEHLRLRHHYRAAGGFVQSLAECTGTCDCCLSGQVPRLRWR